MLTFVCQLFSIDQKYRVIQLGEGWKSKKKQPFQNIYLEDGLPGLGYVVNNHGDRVRPLSRSCGTPSKWPFQSLILQVHPRNVTWNPKILPCKRRNIDPNHQSFFVPAVSFRGSTAFKMFNTKMTDVTTFHFIKVIFTNATF